MEALIYALNIILPVSYITVTIMYGLFFFRSDRTSSKYMSKLLTGTVTIHLIILVLRGYKFGYFPSADIFEMSSVLAFMRLNLERRGSCSIRAPASRI